MTRRWPTLTAVLIQPLLVTLVLLMSWFAGGQDAAPADRNGINTRARPGNMMADSPVRFPKEYGEQILSKILMAFWTAAEPASANVRGSEYPLRLIDPPESGFYAKRLDFEGIPIKAPTNVVDEALFAARERLSMMLSNLPTVRASLRATGAELHIIGRDHVTTDLPEWRQDKGKPLAEYNGLTRDQRTRGMGGLLTSCGEENLLKLEKDRCRGRMEPPTANNRWAVFTG